MSSIHHTQGCSSSLVPFARYQNELNGVIGSYLCTIPEELKKITKFTPQIHGKINKQLDDISNILALISCAKIARVFSENKIFLENLVLKWDFESIQWTYLERSEVPDPYIELQRRCEKGNAYALKKLFEKAPGLTTKELAEGVDLQTLNQTNTIEEMLTDLSTIFTQFSCQSQLEELAHWKLGDDDKLYRID